MKKILILPGDGIGKEVSDAVLPLFDILKLPIEVKIGEIGWEYWRKNGDPIPQKTWDDISDSDAVILGAITSKPLKKAEEELIDELKGKNLKYVSPVIQLRQKLGLFANIRPVFQIIGNNKPFRFTVIRENTEGLYSGIDIKGIPNEIANIVKHPNIEKSGNNSAFSVRLQTEYGLRRLFEYSFKYAINNNMFRVTLADKPNVLRESGQFASDIFYEIASEYPQIRADIQNVDAVALRIVKHPEEFGVIVAENMFGDILSDLSSGVMGGLGLSASANIGSDKCYFEPVHGSYPSKANQNKVNPSAMFFTVALALQHLGFDSISSQIENAIKQVIKRGKVLTYDLGGDSTTTQMAAAIISEIKKPITIKTASILCIGNELLQGKILNGNAQSFSAYLCSIGYHVYQQITCNDNMAAITKSLQMCLGYSDVVIVNGGLGPTSDDLTREAIAHYLDSPIEYNSIAMEHVIYRLESFGIEVDESNKKQAMFPKGSILIKNDNGTACGFDISWNDKRIIALPGPPHEAIPMLTNTIIEKEKNKVGANKIVCMLMGISESNIGTIIDPVLKKYMYQPDIEYLLRYPYVEVSLIFEEEPYSLFVKEYYSVLDNFLASKSNKTAIEVLHTISDFQPLIAEKLQPYQIHEFDICYISTDKRSTSAKTSIFIDKNIAPPWEGLVNVTCTIETDRKEIYTIKIPNSSNKVINYLNEFIAWSFIKHINKES